MRLKPERMTNLQFQLSRRSFVLGGLASAALLDVTARAADLLTFVSPFEAGSAPDLYTRIVAPEMAKLMGRTAVVENKPGAGGNIAAEYVARRPADGSTHHRRHGGAVRDQSTGVRQPALVDEETFAPLVKGVQSPLVLVTHPSVPAKTLDQVVAWVKAIPASSIMPPTVQGRRAISWARRLNQSFGLDLVAVPYQGFGVAGQRADWRTIRR